jgi:hypothetical protein
VNFCLLTHPPAVHGETAMHATRNPRRDRPVERIHVRDRLQRLRHSPTYPRCGSAVRHGPTYPPARGRQSATVEQAVVLVVPAAGRSCRNTGTSPAPPGQLPSTTFSKVNSSGGPMPVGPP